MSYITVTAAQLQQIAPNLSAQEIQLVQGVLSDFSNQVSLMPLTGQQIHQVLQLLVSQHCK